MRKCKLPAYRYTRVGSYEGIALKLLKNMPKPKKMARFYFNKFLTGYQSSHRTQIARTWRLFWRIKSAY